MEAKSTHVRAARRGVAPRPVPGQEEVDPRVAAVLEVLAGRTSALVAGEHGVEPVLLHRWVRAFVESGAARVTNRPEADSVQQRDRFLAALAHEVRTPLAVAHGWASLLADGELDADESEGALLRLDGALGQLTERVREVELLAAASLGRLRLTPRPTTVEDLSSHLTGRGIVGGDGGAVPLHVDHDLFRRMLRDLWRVAGATLPEPRSVRLEVTGGEPWTELRVVREGPAIEPHVLLALFDPFDANDDATGVTLGLYLARALTVAHGGTMGAEQGDDRCTLWLRVPGRPPTETPTTPPVPSEER